MLKLCVPEELMQSYHAGTISLDPTMPYPSRDMPGFSSLLPLIGLSCLLADSSLLWTISGGNMHAHHRV